MNDLVLEPQIEEIVKGVFEMSLDSEVEVISSYPEEHLPGSKVVAMVHILGGWNGVVILDASAKLLSLLAQDIMEGERSEGVSGSQAMAGELVNMIGGNLKPLLGNICALSTPHVFASNSNLYQMVGSVCINRMFFECKGEPFAVRLFAGVGAFSPIT